MKKYLITTFGCQLNENDSEKLAGITEKLGYEKTENLQEADLVIFNTCCVRENAVIIGSSHVTSTKYHTLFILI